ncbi:MAG: outer membrane lipoprotein-sorting protein [Deltaproteobacteria bacterium]|nr:outer membrane lipoprotein-sorting protein [Deltaproteobacteria bacterium]
MSKHLACTLLAAALSLSAASPALALDGEEIMALMDKSLTRATDQYFIYEFVTEEKGKEPRQLKIEVTIKGEKWRRVEFLAPGDIKGMRTLILDTDTIWTYMPAYRKVRRVASHAKAQGFMGTALSHDEMATVTYSPLYKGVLVSEDDKNWTVLGTRREGSGAPYAQVRFVIRKDCHQPTELYYINNKGETVKSDIRTSFKCKQDVCNPRVMVVTDHTRNDLKTTMVQRAWKMNTGVSDRFFTVRAIQRR